MARPSLRSLRIPSGTRQMVGARQVSSPGFTMTMAGVLLGLVATPAFAQDAADLSAEKKAYRHARTPEDRIVALESLSSAAASASPEQAVKALEVGLTADSVEVRVRAVELIAAVASTDDGTVVGQGLVTAAAQYERMVRAEFDGIRYPAGEYIVNLEACLQDHDWWIGSLGAIGLTLDDVIGSSLRRYSTSTVDDIKIVLAQADGFAVLRDAILRAVPTTWSGRGAIYGPLLAVEGCSPIAQRILDEHVLASPDRVGFVIATEHLQVCERSLQIHEKALKSAKRTRPRKKPTTARKENWAQLENLRLLRLTNGAEQRVHAARSWTTQLHLLIRLRASARDLAAPPTSERVSAWKNWAKKLDG